MDWLVRKTAGDVVGYSRVEILRSIEAALASSGTVENAADITDQVEAALYMSFFHKGTIPTVEQIQDFTEETLVLRKLTAAARQYILYREKRSEAKDVGRLIGGIDSLVGDYLGKEDWRVNENSNMNYSLQGLNFYLSSSITARYWLSRIYTPAIKEAHDTGDFHIHDLGILGPYCVGWDLRELLHNGFRGARSKIESAPPRHLRTALGQIVNFFYTLQGEAAGAIAFSNVDTLLAPFIRYDGLSRAEVRQAVQEFIFNMNVPTRVGFQTPFSNITLDLTPSPNFRNSPVVIGGETRPETYGDFQREMDMFNEAFFEIMAHGDAAGRVFSFPIPTINVTRDFDYDRPAFRNLWRITGKYGIPYFSNFVNSDMRPEDTRSMCCRLRLDVAELGRRGGGLFGSSALTGSVGVVTINLPRLGYLSTSVADFKARLGAVMDTARESLEIKRKVLENFTDNGLYPYTKHFLRKIKLRDGNYWSNHFSTIGLVGLNEAAVNLFGESLGEPDGRAFALDILDFMRGRLVEYQRDTGTLYNLEATPAEGTSYRLAKKDTAAFPDIVVANDAAYRAGAAPYYTNSSQLPVSFTDDVFESLDLQDELQTKYTGGTVLHLFLGEKIDDERAVASLVRTVCARYRLPYFSITPTFSICPTHGYLAGQQEACPRCGVSCEVYSRVVGYLRPVTQWNVGKRAEFADRKPFVQPHEGAVTAAP